MKRVLIALVILIVLLFIHSNFTVGVSDYSVSITDLPDSFDGYRIVQLSDLHSRRHPFMMNKIERAKPDIVVMTGDMISSSDADFSTFISLAEKCAQKFPTYFIVGNHEQALDEDELLELYVQLESAGVVILDNTSVAISRGKSEINLYGLWFNLRYYRDINDKTEANYVVCADTVREILGDAEDGVNILLAHNPIYFDGYAEWGADLVLSGHMHGGMVRIPWRGGLLSPEKEYFPKYDAGEYHKDDSSMIISRGLGSHTGFRIFNQPEIVVIELLSE